MPDDLKDEDLNDKDNLDPAELRFVAELRSPVVVDRPAFDARVMAAVAREPAFGSRPAASKRRWTVAAFSFGGAALAAVVAFLLTGNTPAGDALTGTAARGTITEQRPAAAARSAVNTPVSTVRFTLVASGASEVAVAGSFNGWSTAATPLRRIDRNTWAADIPLGAGRYVYQFVIDGHRWVPDPQAPRDPGDDFGATNSVVTVATSGSA